MSHQQIIETNTEKPDGVQATLEGLLLLLFIQNQ